MTQTDAPDAPQLTQTVYRIEIWPKAGEADALAHPHEETVAQRFGDNANLRAASIYLIQSPISPEQANQIATELLCDPVCQEFAVGVSPIAENAGSVEVHYKPGVMDPVAQSTKSAILEMLGSTGLTAEQLEVTTGARYDVLGATPDEAALTEFAQASLANPVIQDIYAKAYHPESFMTGTPYEMHLTHVPMRDLDDEALTKLSREGHLFLSLEEMKAIQDYYRKAEREPTDIELETFAQTWSEHCVHKTLKSTVHYTQPEGDDAINWASRPGHEVHEDGSVTIHNLLKSTIAAATNKLMTEHGMDKWCVSVFVDNAGIVKLDDEDAVCIKVETHNHPSAIEPYGGAATGIGGCIRDIMGTGLAGKPIANTDVFCVAHPQQTKPIPTGVIPPKRILQQVVAGVRDYGNRMGIPTVNGSVWFHDDYLGNPLVFAGCVGMIPLDKCFGDPQPGDHIIAIGGRTGRDGIHGATFSSAELTDTHADEFSHAVQIGNAITEKQTLDVILQARDHEGGPLFSAITDCGAGGFSSAVGEMGEKVGAKVILDNAPLKYRGLSYTEIWISEAQERMVLSVPEEHVEKVMAICASEDVEVCDLGTFGYTNDAGEPELILTYREQEVGRLSMPLLHDGIPTPTRKAQWTPGKYQTAQSHPVADKPSDMGDALKTLLAHPNIASKHWIIRQYDHEVQGGAAVKPLTGPNQDGPSDASVLRPKLGSNKGIALGGGLQTGMGEKSKGDSYWMTLAAIDEAVRNVVCTGADPSRICILDNFCWPSCDKPENLGSLVRSAEACYDGSLAYKTPFVSGKDSLNNQFTTDSGEVISIPPTMLISAMGIVQDATRTCTMDAKSAGNILLMIGNTTSAMLGSHYTMSYSDTSRDMTVPRTDLHDGPCQAAIVAGLIHHSKVVSAHDCSDGGLLVAAAEMAFAGGIGLDMDLTAVASTGKLDDVSAAFAETPSRYLLEVKPENLDEIIRLLRDKQIPFGEVGRFNDSDKLTVRSAEAGQLLEQSLAELKAAWLGTLDW
ncbi:MAG: phosphoribosylformylglycinamidine synthase subunit PurL [Phycisphaeraceae bacterium]|nr:phosphoribosylformylglycinamidine synthase subunit PurL [Phycisphaeraceae bacterium]